MGCLVLAVDTATEAVAIGIARYSFPDLQGDLSAGPLAQTLYSESHLAHRQANALLLERVAAALAQVPADVTDIGAVVTGLGPGSFTGVRIGVATAKGLAHALGVPLYGVTTASAIAHRVALTGFDGTLLVAADAMRKEVYPSLFSVTGGQVTRYGQDFVTTPQGCVEWWLQQLADGGVDTGTLLVAGSGLDKYGDLLTAPLGAAGYDYEVAVAELSHPDGAGLLAAFEADVLESAAPQSGLPGALLPVYTRLSDAEENERKRQGMPERPVVVDTVSSLPDGTYYRRLAPWDLPDMLALEREDTWCNWSDGQFAEEFELGASRYWVGAFQAGQLIGMAGLARTPDTAEVLKVAVNAAYRRRGVGTALVRHLGQQALEWRADTLQLEVRASNRGARALYEALGFNQDGVRPSYYTSPVEDAVTMSLQLVPPNTAHRWWGGDSPGSAEQPTAGTPAGHGQPCILGIESSCDETAAAVLRGNQVLANVVASQIDFHARFGGVVPEIASRKHTEAIVGVIDATLEQAGAGTSWKLPLSALDALAVTSEPGLIGALVVGLAYAKGFSLGSGLPLYGINHLEGHLYANVLDNPDVEAPFVALVVSGGHTSLIYADKLGSYRTLGETLDDATGEAFDKVAKVLGLGYPGGPVLSRLAEQGNPHAINFPRAMMGSGDYAFSLSGLKTAVINYIRNAETRGEDINVPDLAASFQQAIIDVQVSKAVAAAQEHQVRWFLLAGGVAANSALRAALTDAMAQIGVSVSVPGFSLCTDNAAMITRAAVDRFGFDEPLSLGADARAHAPLDTL